MAENWVVIVIAILGLTIAILLNTIFVYIPVRRIESTITQTADDVNSAVTKIDAVAETVDNVANQVGQIEADIEQILDTVEEIALDVKMIIEYIESLINGL